MSLNLQEVAVVKAMLAKGEKQHDIAAHFGVNGGHQRAYGTDYNPL